MRNEMFHGNKSRNSNDKIKQKCRETKSKRQMAYVNAKSAQSMHASITAKVRMIKRKRKTEMKRTVMLLHMLFIFIEFSSLICTKHATNVRSQAGEIKKNYTYTLEHHC